MQQKTKVFQIEIFARRLFTRRFDKNSTRMTVSVKFSHDRMQGVFDTKEFRKERINIEISQKKMTFQTR